MIKVRDSGDPAEAISSWRDLRWPVKQLAILRKVPEDLRRSFVRQPLPPGGIFFPDGATVRGGVLQAVPVPGRDDYSPVEESAALVDAALRVDAGSVEALTAFVNTWGRLGVGLRWTSHSRRFSWAAPPGIPGGWNPRHDADYDGVYATADALEEFQFCVRWLKTAQERRWNSLAVPKPEDVRSILMPEVARTFPAKLSVRDYSRLHTLALAQWIAPYVQGVHPTIRSDPDAGSVPAWRIRWPVELLWVTLWEWATGGAQLRRCPHCGVLFPAEHARRRYCGRTCVNNANAARWYQKRGRRLRKQRRAARHQERQGSARNGARPHAESGRPA
jgi:hypothetical protein